MRHAGKHVALILSEEAQVPGSTQVKVQMSGDQCCELWCQDAGKHQRLMSNMLLYILIYFVRCCAICGIGYRAEIVEGIGGAELHRTKVRNVV